MSAEFIAEEGVLKGLILSLDIGEEWTIGRDPEQVTLVIEDPKVSRRHLICRKTPEGYVIENLSDVNPVLINDQLFSGPKLLQEGDKVTIGGTVFHFYPEGAPPTYAFEPEYAFESEESFLGDFQEEEEEKLDHEDEAPEETPEEIHPVKEEESSSDEEEEKPEEEPSLTPIEEEEGEEEDELLREEIFREAEGSEEFAPTIDLTPTTRYLIKVIAGPNTGAEFALDLDREYLIGTDPATCDLIFNDLSVSREHARLSVNKEGGILIEDLGSRNGVVVDKERILSPKKLTANAVIALGTSAFLLIDREAPSETIVAPIFEAPPEEEEKVPEEEGEEEKVVLPAAKKPRRTAATGSLVLALFVAGLAVLFGIGMVSLLQTEEVVTEKIDYHEEIQAILKDYPGVRYTYNITSEKLFLMGHVRTAVEMSELLYKIKGLTFIRVVENNIVNDEAVWQEMNILLSKMPEFKGVSMHSPEPGVFVISGYLKTERQAVDLIDYLNVNFPYIARLQNRVVVEQQIIDEVTAHLIQHGFGAVSVAFSTGELVLTGYIGATQVYEYESLVDSFDEIPGIRSIKNFVVAVTPEVGVIDLNQRFPGRYRVTGFSKHGDVNINVVINGRILARGDKIDGMTITSIQPHTIFFEKDGVKYKLDYNR
ncbi:MAG: type III secretion system inner membrane ring subunit SctD [Chlamydiales bacterium]|nr:type III secretion system inner membrane ring subunit SctD [Chlamydiales bacterium]